MGTGCLPPSPRWPWDHLRVGSGAGAIRPAGRGISSTSRPKTWEDNRCEPESRKHRAKGSPSASSDCTESSHGLPRALRLPRTPPSSARRKRPTVTPARLLRTPPVNQHHKRTLPRPLKPRFCKKTTSPRGRLATTSRVYPARQWVEAPPEPAPDPQARPGQSEGVCE